MRRRFRRFRSQLNNTRLTLLVTLLFTMLVATIFPTPAIRFTVALFCAGPFVSYIAARFFARPVKASRMVPPAVTVGDVLHGRILVENTAPYPTYFTQIMLGQAETETDAVPPLEALDGTERVFATLRADEHVTLPADWQANRRGVWQLSPLCAGATDPLGLSSALRAHSAPQTITVLPRPLHLVKLGFLTGSRNGTRPLSHAASVNEAMDFHGIRAWRPGEGMRRVHWKSTARTGELHVIEWEEDLSADLMILLDVQVPPRHPDGKVSPELETAVTIVASIAAYLLANGNAFEVFYWQSVPVPGAPKVRGKVAQELKLCRHRARGIAGLSPTLHQLAEIQPLTAPEASLANLAERAGVNREFNVLLLTLHDNDISAAVNRLYENGIPSRQCTVLSLEPESETDVQSSGGKFSRQKDTSGKANKNGSQKDQAASGVRTRRIKAGESLTALLERD